MSQAKNQPNEAKKKKKGPGVHFMFMPHPIAFYAYLGGVATASPPPLVFIDRNLDDLGFVCLGRAVQQLEQGLGGVEDGLHDGFGDRAQPGLVEQDDQANGHDDPFAGAIEHERGQRGEGEHEAVGGGREPDVLGVVGEVVIDADHEEHALLRALEVGEVFGRRLVEARHQDLGHRKRAHTGAHKEPEHQGKGGQQK